MFIIKRSPLNKLILPVFLYAMLFSGTSHALSDPTRPAFFYEAEESQQATQQPLQLNMILLSEAKKTAVINGKAVTLGDLVNGYQVTRIYQNSVVVSYQGQTKKIYLGKAGEYKKTQISRRLK